MNQFKQRSADILKSFKNAKSVAVNDFLSARPLKRCSQRRSEPAQMHWVCIQKEDGGKRQTAEQYCWVRSTTSPTTIRHTSNYKFDFNFPEVPRSEGPRCRCFTAV